MAAWGARRSGVDDVVTRLRKRKGDSGAPTTICLLSNRKVGPSEAVKIAEALEDNDTLTELLCSGHAIGAEGSRAIGKALAKNSTLERLCVGDVELGNESAAAILEGLVQCGAQSRLREIDLELKGIDGAGAALLGPLISKCVNLKILRLDEITLARMGRKSFSTVCPQAPRQSVVFDTSISRHAG